MFLQIPKIYTRYLYTSILEQSLEIMFKFCV